MANDAVPSEAHAETGTTAHTEAPGGAPAHAEPTALKLDASMWVALVMMVVIALALWKKVPAGIGKSLDAKIAEIREQLAEAESVRKEAEALKAEYEAKAAAADGEAQAIIARAHTDAEGIVAKAETDAKALVTRRQAMAEAKIAAEERAAIDELRATAAKAASAAAAKLIADGHGATSDKKLVDDAIAGL